MTRFIRNITPRKGFLLATSFVFSLATSHVALADDTEIFVGAKPTGAQSNPNILFVFDTSGSMRSSVSGDPLGRDRLAVVQDVVTDMLDTMTNVNVGLMKFDYRGWSGDRTTDGGMVVHEVAPVEANRTSLKNEINFMTHAGATPLSEAYYEAAKYMLGDNVDFGLNSYEVYKSGSYYYRQSRPSVSASRNGNSYDSPITGKCQRNYIVLLTDGQPNRDQNGKARIETLLKDNRFNDHQFTSCADDHPVYYSSGTRHGGGECMDELADFLYKNDLDTNITGKQNVVTHTIGFAADFPLLKDTATNGGGSLFLSNDANTLRDNLTEILDQVVDDTNGFTAPAVTVNAFDRTSHLDQLFFTLFEPSASVHWDGNVKKYRFVEDGSSSDMVIIGQDDAAAVNPATGFFFDGRDQTGAIDPNTPVAHSYWSPQPDGADVRVGGTTSQFDLARNVLTCPGSSCSSLLSHPINENNSAMKAALNGMPLPAALGGLIAGNTVDGLLKWAGGIDMMDFDEDGSTSDTRQQMGDPLHSKPAVVVYGGNAGTPQLVLFVGTNDGYLHAINGETGKEHFAFMPKSLWKNIPTLAENREDVKNKVYGVDGPITVWKYDGGDGQVDPASGDFVYLYFGLRRGGNEYYAMDVSDPDRPKLMWTIGNTGAFARLGETWSKPTRTRMNFGTVAAPDIKDVLVFGGGYDNDQDGAESHQDDDEGNAIFIVDAKSGAHLWSISDTSGTVQNADMTNSFPAGVRVIDLDLDGIADRMYANDIAGRLWRLDIHNPLMPADQFEITAGVIAELGGTVGGASNADNRRFYYAPDVALGNDHGLNFLTITMSSGFRGHPLDGTHNDYLLGVRDYNGFVALKTDVEYDYGVEISDLDTVGGSTSSLPPGSAGFKLALNFGDKEKALAQSRIFQGKAYYTTYTPGAAPASNPCAPALGSGRLYVVDLATGQSDVKILKKPGIPPEPTFIFGKDDSINYNPGPACYGSHCAPPPPPCTGPSCPPEPDDDGRKIECLAGPESCEAGAVELPQRTYWRQQDPNQ